MHDMIDVSNSDLKLINIILIKYLTTLILITIQMIFWGFNNLNSG